MATKQIERLVTQAVCQVEYIEVAERALHAGRTQDAAQALADARQQQLRAGPPVPVSVAAKLLKVSEPTIRSWADTGVLTDAHKRPRAITLENVVDVHRRLGELRERGHHRNPPRLYSLASTTNSRSRTRTCRPRSVRCDGAESAQRRARSPALGRLEDGRRRAAVPRRTPDLQRRVDALEAKLSREGCRAGDYRLTGNHVDHMFALIYAGLPAIGGSFSASQGRTRSPSCRSEDTTNEREEHLRRSVRCARPRGSTGRPQDEAALLS